MFGMFKRLFTAFLLLTVGASAAETGYLPTTDTSRLGTQTVYWTGITNVFTDNGTYATWSATNDTSAWKFFKLKNEGFQIDAFQNDALQTGQGVTDGATIDSIRVKINAREQSDVAADIGAFLSWNGGTGWTAQQTITVTTSTDADYFSTANSTWGRTWTVSELENGNFRVKFTGLTNPAIDNADVDIIWVNVWYTSAGGDPRRQRILKFGQDDDPYSGGIIKYGGLDEKGNAWTFVCRHRLDR